MNQFTFVERLHPREWNLIHSKNPHAYRIKENEGKLFKVATLLSIFPNSSLHSLTNKNVKSKLANELKEDFFFIWYEYITHLSVEKQVLVIRHCESILAPLLYVCFKEMFTLYGIHEVCHLTLAHLIDMVGEGDDTVFSSLLIHLYKKVGETVGDYIVKENFNSFAIRLATRIRKEYPSRVRNLSEFVYELTKDLLSFVCLKYLDYNTDATSINMFACSDTLKKYIRKGAQEEELPVLRYIDTQLSQFIDVFSLQHCACCKRNVNGDDESVGTLCCKDIRYCDLECKTSHERIHDAICKPVQGNCFACKQAKVSVKICVTCNQSYCNKTCLETHVHAYPCTTCQTMKPWNEFLMCSGCMDLHYCDRVCQKKDWVAGHKLTCTAATH